jgi:hypothetical protein
LVLTNIVGCIKKGTLAERPAHAAYLTDYLYYVNSGSNLGDLYWNDGSAWVLLQGATKTEVLQNKIIDPSLNPTTGLILDPFLTQKRQGYLIPSITADASLRYGLKGVPVGSGTYSLVRDATEGYVSRFNSSSVVEMGYRSNATINLVTRRAYNPRLKVRCRSTNADNTYMFLGFSTKLPTPSGAFPIDATASGVIVGTTYTNANYLMRTADGAAFTHTNTTIPRDSIFRTFEIIMSASNIVVNIDATTTTLTTNLPGLNTDLYLLIELHNRTGTNSFEISKGYFSSD